MKTRNIILTLLVVISLIWSVDAFWLAPLQGDTIWVFRKNAIYLSGLISIVFMSIAMYLALRPTWLEDNLNGLDKIYHLHKWLGITAISAGLTHWLLKLAGSPIASFYGKANKPARDAVLGFMTDYRSFGKDLGEWTIYILLALLALSLYKRFPYKPWRLLHKVMPVIYLLLVFHTFSLMPMSYWYGLSGTITAISLAIGSYAAIYTLTQKIGANNKYQATIKEIKELADNVLEISCQVGQDWPQHKAGQFAFIKFAPTHEAHPFTIASAYELNKNTLNFKIKALGDYTKTLQQQLKVGQVVEIEGPYGRFTYKPKSGHQIWIAAGIGVTPFIAWLESLQNENLSHTVDLHYSLRSARDNQIVDALKNLAANIPNLHLFIHDASQKNYLDSKKLAIELATKSDNIDIWFCGPNGFAKKLKDEFSNLRFNHINFHQEIFEFR